MNASSRLKRGMRYVAGLIVLGLVGCAGASGRDPAVAQARAAHSCEGLGDADMQLLEGPGKLVSVEAVRRPEGKQQVLVTRGARLYLRADRGMTAPYMERLAECRAARAQLAGNDPAHDPFAVPGVDIQARERGSMIELTLLSDHPPAAREVADRASAAHAHGLRAQAIGTAPSKVD